MEEKWDLRILPLAKKGFVWVSQDAVDGNGTPGQVFKLQLPGVRLHLLAMHLLLHL